MLATPNSTAIRASKLPTKLDSSIYLVYSDIAMPEYQQSNQKLNIVGVIPRNYSAGDYVYSFGDNSFGHIPIKQKRKLTSVRTEIRTPNGDLAPINEKSTIIYKIIKPYQQPQAELIINPVPNIQEQMLYQMKKQNKKMNDLVSLLLELFDKKLEKNQKKHEKNILAKIKDDR
jgi:stalled ribosome alternative rescue factor ArfA